MKNFLYYSISAILLSSCAGSSIDKQGLFLFDAKPITDSTPVKKARSLFNKSDADLPITAFAHPPVQNPGGVQFNSDKEFVKSYNLYQKKNKKHIAELDNKTTQDDTEKKAQKIDQFLTYKLLGATKVDTSSASWDVDYIPPPKEKSVGEKFMQVIGLEPENSYEREITRQKLFGQSSSVTALFSKVKGLFGTKAEKSQSAHTNESAQQSIFNSSNVSLFDSNENINTTEISIEEQTTTASIANNSNPLIENHDNENNNVTLQKQKNTKSIFSSNNKGIFAKFYTKNLLENETNYYNSEYDNQDEYPCSSEGIFTTNNDEDCNFNNSNQIIADDNITIYKVEQNDIQTTTLSNKKSPFKPINKQAIITPKVKPILN